MKKRIQDMGERFLKDGKIYGLLLALLLAYYFMVRIRFHAFCPMVIVTGIPCPGCGMTRAVLLLLLGEFRRSWNLNPMAAVWIAIALWFGFRRYWCGKKVTGLKYMIGMTLIAMLLVYLYRMYTSFPSYPPIVYTKDNVLARYIPGYRQWLESIIYSAT